MNGRAGIPIIKLEVEGMRHTVYHALSEHAAAMDESVKAAVDAFCTPENIDSIVRGAVMEHMNAAVKEEVRDFFRYNGAGRKAVREAVIQHLDEWDRLYSRVEG